MIQTKTLVIWIILSYSLGVITNHFVEQFNCQLAVNPPKSLQTSDGKLPKARLIWVPAPTPTSTERNK